MFCYVFQMVICKSISLFCNTWYSDEIWHIYLNIHMDYVTNKMHGLYLSPFSSYYVPFNKDNRLHLLSTFHVTDFLVNTSHTSYALCLQLTWITSTNFHLKPSGKFPESVITMLPASVFPQKAMLATILTLKKEHLFVY